MHIKMSNGPTDDDEEETNISFNNNNGSDEFTRRNLEFAQKLGYSKDLIHTALTRLGAEAKQNELLAELIKLSADLGTPKLTPTCAASNNAVSFSSNVGFVVQLRHIVIDGSNVALSHGNNETFSCRGIRICVDWFRQRGHLEITAFVPNWRKESSRTIGNNNISDQDILYELERERVLVFTPSRLLEGKRVACYDDRYILRLAAETDGIVVSNDNYRDLSLESLEFRKVVQERLLMYSFVNDRFMPPDDPLGRAGPTLDVFLRQPQKGVDSTLQLCPYGKKCTYGSKCKYRHQPNAAYPLLPRMPLTSSLSAPLNFNGNISGGGGGNGISNSACKLTQPPSREPLNRTKSNTLDQMCQPVPVCNQLSTKYGAGNLASSTPNNANWTSQQLDLHNAGGGDEINRHKKLQRQVPQLNGTGYAPHRLLVPTISAPPPLSNVHSTNSNNNSNRYKHQQLQRITSAPVSQTPDLQIPQIQHNAFLSASDSRINEELHTSQSREERRRLLRYHLSNLFPQNQVHAVLQLYPDETDAKTICAAILQLFPHN